MSTSEDGSSQPSMHRVIGSKAASSTDLENLSMGGSSLSQTYISNIQSQGLRQRRTSLSKRLIGRTSISPTPSPELAPHRIEREENPSFGRIYNYQDLHHDLLSQISQWLHREKARLRDTSQGKNHFSSPLAQAPEDSCSQNNPRIPTDHAHWYDTEAALEDLEKIIEESKDCARKLFNDTPIERHLIGSRRKSSVRKQARKLSLGGGSSDTDYFEGDMQVPSVDAVLDNSKTLGFTGGAATSEFNLTRTSSKSAKEESWLQFKSEIIRLTHTLRLKGWRQIPLDGGSEIDVQRLSGALTNVIYIVTPPDRFLKSAMIDNSSSSVGQGTESKRRPNKLLLRVYGPQVEHLINRDVELRILQRLARKNIGPRLLGTFQNGRFEEYLNARPLTPEEMRHPETSKQIAKRMRELHDGIDLLDQERAAGPYVWQNWDKWVTRCGEVITWLDSQIPANQEPISTSNSWSDRGFVCGVEWSTFRRAVDMFRVWLDKQYGGVHKVRDQLIFAHNDTQYGNLLRIEPAGESPLLLPANEHRQLVVIDFEYANANPRGMEFANHFTEWCYNYHSPTHPFACNVAAYPSPKEQQRFLYAYVQHTPQLASNSPKPALRKSASMISSFMLDSRTPSTQYDAEEAIREEKVKTEVEQLTRETRLWRVANSAQWVAWGIVQAKVPGMNEALEEQRKRGLAQTVSVDSGACVFKNKLTDSPGTLAKQDSFDEGQKALFPNDAELEPEPEFDYLAYAQQRAFFFWGDLLELGLIKEEDLPAHVCREAKRIPY